MRSYQHKRTGSHQNSEVKRALARVVLGWVTPWEVLVFHPFHFCYLKIQFNFAGSIRESFVFPLGGNENGGKAQGRACGV